MYRGTAHNRTVDVMKRSDHGTQFYAHVERDNGPLAVSDGENDLAER